MEERRVCISAETLQPSAWIFSFFHFVAALDASPTKDVGICRPGNQTQQSVIFVVHLGTAGTDPADSTLKFDKSLNYIDTT